MKFLLFSSSNVQHKRNDNTSTKTWMKIIDLLVRHSKVKIDTSLITLLDYNFKLCIFCGECANNGIYPYDKDFNKIFQLLKESDGLFLVVPHYSIIPAKLTILLEKLNQFYYTAWIKNPKVDFSLKGKKVAIIGHGGGGDERIFDHIKQYQTSDQTIHFQEASPLLGLYCGPNALSISYIGDWDKKWLMDKA